MANNQVRTRVRSADDGVAIIELNGDVTAASETELMDAYQEAGRDGTGGIVLDFTRLDYMNSSGIGLLVTLLVRAKRAHQQVSAYGLSDHYREIFAITRLSEFIHVYDDEPGAVGHVPART